MKKYFLPFVLFWLLDSLILYLGVLIFPHYFVLGSKMVSFWGAIFVAGFTWTVLVWLLKPTIFLFTKKIKGSLAMFAFYLVLNFVALWITARLGPVVGFGTTRFVWLVVIASVANLIQYAAWKLCMLKKIVK